MAEPFKWKEVRDRTRLWCKIDAKRCLIEIVHRGERKYIDLRAYGLIYVGPSALGRDDVLPAEAGEESGLSPQAPGSATEPEALVD